MPRLSSPRLIFYLLFMITLEVSLAPLFPEAAPRPAFLYLSVLYAAFEWVPAKTFRMALAAGLLRDLATGQPLGVETAVLVSLGLGLGFIVQKIEREFFIMRFACTFLFIFFADLGVSILSGFYGLAYGLSGRITAISFGNALVSALVMPFFFSLSRRWFKDRVFLKQYELFT